MRALRGACLASAIGLMAAAPALAREETSEPLGATAATLADLTASGGAGELTWIEADWTALDAFYIERHYAPAWIEGAGLSAAGRELVDTLAAAANEGLFAGAYLTAELMARLDTLDATSAATSAVELDLLLTNAFLRYGSDLMVGRAREREATPRVIDFSADVDLLQPLRFAVESGAVAETLARLAPTHEQYARLRDALSEYRALAAAGGWALTPDAGSHLEQGQTHPAVAALRARLSVTGDYVAPEEGVEDAEFYDQALAEAVIRFQGRHGLLQDAVVGPRTREALNVTVEQRIDQIVTSMERWRWLPRDLGPRYIMVNVPEFRLRAVNEGDDTVEMRVIVGLRDHQTPVFNGTMTYISMNPYWNVPSSIATEEYLPELLEDPMFLLNRSIRILSESGEVDPTSVDWAEYAGQRFPFRMRQDPGNGNALGRIKFMFPNRHAVYLHDTPSRRLFDRTTRAFSHGCIRVQRPMDLAEFVFDPEPDYDRERVEATIASRRTVNVTLENAIPVYVVYRTGWVGDDGAVNFYRDIYGRDAALGGALADMAPDEAVRVALN